MPSDQSMSVLGAHNLYGRVYGRVARAATYERIWLFLSCTSFSVSLIAGSCSMCLTPSVRTCAGHSPHTELHRSVPHPSLLCTSNCVMLTAVHVDTTCVLVLLFCTSSEHMLYGNTTRLSDCLAALPLSSGMLVVWALYDAQTPHQHPLGENNGVALQRGSHQGHLGCPAPPAEDFYK